MLSVANQEARNYLFKVNILNENFKANMGKSLKNLDLVAICPWQNTLTETYKILTSLMYM